MDLGAEPKILFYMFLCGLLLPRMEPENYREARVENVVNYCKWIAKWIAWVIFVQVIQAG